MKVQMEVQKVIQDCGIEALSRDPYYVNYKIYDNGLVILNYDQIKSPKYNKVCCECRALILDATNNYNVVSRSFDRFFNLGEGSEQQKINFDQSTIFEKVDGSIMVAYYHDRCWNVQTRSMVNAEGNTKLGNTFKYVFERIFDLYKLSNIPTNLNLIFEMVSPETRVVKRYTEANVYLIGVRDRLIGNELSLNDMLDIANDLNVPVPQIYKFSDINECLKIVKELPAMDEGYVLMQQQFGSHYRIKIKNPGYLAIAHLKNNGQLSIARILYLIVSGDEAEYLTYFPEDTEVFKEYRQYLKEIKNNTLSVFNEAPKTSRKDFALYVKSHNLPYNDLLFRLANGQSWESIEKSFTEPQGLQYLEKIVNRLKNK